MPSLAQLTTLAPWHILSYGTLFGSTFFQSFVGGITAFRALPRPQFAQLQKNLFPVYFRMQTALSSIMAFTYPFGGIQAVLAPENRLTVALPLATIFATSLVNTIYLGPETTRVMVQRHHQETRDGKKAYDQGPHSTEMQRLNKQFGMLHGVSTLANLAGFAAMIWHGFVLAEKLVA